MIYYTIIISFIAHCRPALQHLLHIPTLYSAPHLSTLHRLVFIRVIDLLWILFRHVVLDHQKVLLLRSWHKESEMRFECYGNGNYIDHFRHQWGLKYRGDCQYDYSFHLYILHKAWNHKGNISTFDYSFFGNLCIFQFIGSVLEDPKAKERNLIFLFI